MLNDQRVINSTEGPRNSTKSWDGEVYFTVRHRIVATKNECVPIRIQECSKYNRIGLAISQRSNLAAYFTCRNNRIGETVRQTDKYASCPSFSCELQASQTSEKLITFQGNITEFFWMNRRNVAEVSSNRRKDGNTD